VNSNIYVEINYFKDYPMNRFYNDSIRIEANEIDENHLEIVFKGELYIINEKFEKEVIEYFDNLLKEFFKHKVIILDFTNLNSMSSYGVRLIIEWMKKVQTFNKQNNSNFEVKIIYDNSIEWQEATFTSLKEIFNTFAEYLNI
jgi:anti-anti-sigma regulatory factor